MTAQSFAICLMLFTTSAFGQVTFILQDIPRGTPAEDTIYLTGSFTGWKSLPEYRLKRRLDGRLAITLPPGTGSFEYKFNRGDWQRAETDENNHFLPNRTFIFGNGDTVYITIYNWQDVGGAKPFNFLTFYFFAASMLILPVGYYLRQVKNRKKSLTRAVSVFISMICLALAGRVLFEIVPMNWQIIFEQAGIILFAATAPAWVQMISSSLDFNHRHYSLWIPTVLVAAYVILKYFLSPALPLLNGQFIDLMTVDEAIILALITASLINSWISAVILIRNSNTQNNTNGLQRTVAMKFLWAGMIMIIFTLGVDFMAIGESSRRLLWISQNFPFCAGSIMLIIVTNIVFRHTDIFKQPPTTIRRSELEELKERVHNEMTTRKFYLNPALTLPELADALGMKPHTLSKVINDGFEQNFRDFVNKYRVDEFIRLVKDETNKRYTFLALAYEVGFNSKSTFNAAFKKNTHHSPREYFQSEKSNSLMPS
jgi:AraC-like DNA-binding protein